MSELSVEDILNKLAQWLPKNGDWVELTALYDKNKESHRYGGLARDCPPVGSRGRVTNAEYAEGCPLRGAVGVTWVLGEAQRPWYVPASTIRPCKAPYE
jgi:hypothetical protein